ncbi:MAG: copper resistance protein CopC, partial [Acidimicrobiales bacterium]
ALAVRRRIGAGVAGALLAVAAMAWAAGPADAHALLASSVPADGASVDQAPTEMILIFTEALDPALSTVHLLDSAGQDADAGDAVPVAGQRSQLRVPLGSLGEGTYTATWRVTSPADGHTTVGSVAFGVGVPAVAAGAGGGPVNFTTPAPTPASVIGRWLFYVGVVLLVGAAAVGIAVLSSPAAISRRALVGAWVAAGAGVLVTVADQRAAAQTSLGVLLASATGRRLSAQVAAVAVTGVAVAWACRRRSRWALAAVGVAASGAMLARALAGHANAASPRWFTVGMQWAHLTAVGAWVGGLAWYLLALRRGDPGQGRGLTRRFSTVAGWTLGVVVVSGTFRAFDEVGAWGRLAGTSFGVALLVKLALVAALVGLGATIRFRHARPASPAPARRSAGLRRLARGEVAIAAGVLGATAVLTGLPPSVVVAAASKAVAPPALTVTGNDYATSVRVRMEVTPGSAGPNTFDALVEDYDTGEPVPADAVTLRFQLLGRADVAAATLNLAPDVGARWRGSGTMLSIAGSWTVTAVVQSPADTVEVPMEVVIRSTAPPAKPATEPAGCGKGTPDPAYRVAVDTDPNPPKAEATEFRLTVQRDGQPVAGAKVCLRLDMREMNHPGVSAIGEETSPGSYDARLKFSMTGSWEGSTTVVEPGRRPVQVPIKLAVT